MEKYWYCLRHHKQLTNKESKKCKGCESLSLTLIEENKE